MRYRCPNCGHIFLGKREKCPACSQRFVYPALPEKESEPLEEKKVEEKPAPEVKPEPKVSEKQPIVAPNPAPAPKPAPFVKKGKSRFTGTTLQLIGWRIAGFFVTLFTIGICYPVALGWIYRWEVNHTVVEGHRLRFDGYASSLIPRWILWMLLSVITLGIFALTLPVRFQKWKVSRTVIVD